MRQGRTLHSRCGTVDFVSERAVHHAIGYNKQVKSSLGFIAVVFG